MVRQAQLDLLTYRTRATQARKLGSLREQLPPSLRFGSIGWCFSGWGKDVWDELAPKELQHKGLRRYAAHPLFSTLCLPAATEPLPQASLHHIGSQLPADFSCVISAPLTVTAARLTRVGGFGHRAGRTNRTFLDPAHFINDVWQPAKRALGDRLELAVLSFPAQLGAAGIPPDGLSWRLERFLAEIGEVPCAIEIREPDYLTLQHAKVLAAFGTSHVYTTAPGMPTFAEQARWVPSGRWQLFRLADPVGIQYPSDAQRRRALVAQIAEQPNRPTHVWVANIAEGSTPETLEQLMKLCVARFAMAPEQVRG